MAPIQDTEFAVLPIEMPGTAAYPKSAIHEVRIRRNAPKIPTDHDARSLFLKNIPSDSTEAHFRAIFTNLVGAGRFESILFDDEKVAALSSVDPAYATKVAGFPRKRKRSEVELEEIEREEREALLPETWARRLYQSSSTAVVLMADEKSVQLVLKAIAKVHKTRRYPTWGEDMSTSVPSLGSNWVSSHLRLSRADKATTQQSVHAFFNVFNRKEKEAAELSKRLRNEPDEDGFVTVTRGGRAAPASRNEAEEAKRRMVDKQSKKKSDMQDFYRFQLRERRKEEQAELQKRFDEDRKKVSAMQEKRGKFKPEA